MLVPQIVGSEDAAYTCPMHPNIVRTMPGMCPECGMSLIPKKKKTGPAQGHGADDKHAGHKTSSFLVKFWVSLVLTIPIFIYSDMAMEVFDIHVTMFWGYQYVTLMLASVVFFYPGLIFLTSAYREIRARLPGMMTLIALAITAAYSYSVFSIVQGVGHDLLFELASLITIMLLGHWIEMKSVQSAQGALKELAKLLPDTAEVLRDGKTQTITLSELVSGDMVLVRPGSNIPADGTVVEGQSEINESIITGESKPVNKKIGDTVIAGSINGDGSLTVRVDKIGEATFLAGVMRLVAEAQASKSRLQAISDRAALYLTMIALVVGATTFAVWLLVGAGIVTATERLVAVLVITCPHALGLAVPLVASISTTMAARNGFLIRQRIALEVARSVDTVLFDKTGTLTLGMFGVHAVMALPSSTENEVLSRAASLNYGSEHPLGKAIVAESHKRGQKLSDIKDFERVPGKGARGMIAGHMTVVGNESLMADAKVVVSHEILGKTRALENEGKTVIFVASDGVLMGSIALADTIREESREAIRVLRSLGIRTAMITGDAPDVAAWVARELGIDEYFARVLPHEKAEKVKLLQGKGNKVAMVGDGINDAPALTQADLGIAIGAGTNVAIESAGIILVKNDPRDIPKIIKLSQLTYSKMMQNLFWATGYNILAIPLAAGVLASRGIVLEPAVAAVLMSVSTVIVAFNALLLRRQIISL